MRIFISYASDYQKLAEEIATELRPFGHRVFLDRHDLAAGETYTDQIRNSIRQCDLFVFLITPEAVTPGRYTMTELQVMQELAPSPGSRVLPVMAAPTPMKDIPDYLSSVTILIPKGDVVTETLNAISGLESRARRQRAWKAGAIGVIVVGLVGLTALTIIAFPRQVTLSALRDPFSVYGTNFVSKGQTATVRLTNKRPDLLPDYSCKVILAPALSANVKTFGHDKRCETITLQLKHEPFEKPDGTLIEQVSYDRHPMSIDVAAENGEIVWRGKWEIGLRNFVETTRFSLRPISGDAQFEILFDRDAIGSGYACRVRSGNIAIGADACVVKRTGAPPMVGTVTILHPRTGWAQDYTFDPIH